MEHYDLKQPLAEGEGTYEYEEEDLLTILEYDRYREEFCRLRTKCIVGFIIGVVCSCAILFSEGTFFLPSAADIAILVVFSSFFIGLPCGWELTGKVVAGWTLYAHILVHAFILMVRFAISLCLGAIVWPFLLLYYYMKSKPHGSRARKISKTVFIILIAWNIIGLVIMGVTGNLF